MLSCEHVKSPSLLIMAQEVQSEAALGGEIQAFLALIYKTLGAYFPSMLLMFLYRRICLATSEQILPPSTHMYQVN